MKSAVVAPVHSRNVWELHTCLKSVLDAQKIWEPCKTQNWKSFGVKRRQWHLAVPLLCGVYGYCGVWTAVAYCPSCPLKMYCLRSAHFFGIAVQESEQLRSVIEGHPVTVPGCADFFPEYVLDSRFWHLRNHEFLPPEILLFLPVKNSRCWLCKRSR